MMTFLINFGMNGRERPSFVPDIRARMYDGRIILCKVTYELKSRRNLKC